jgi:hypothetical protein
MRYFTLLLFLLFTGSVNANHIVGFTLHAGYSGTADDYRITYKLYRNCSGPAAPSVYMVRYERDGVLQGALFLSQVSSAVHINQLCIISTPVNCAGGFGIEEITYETTVSLPVNGTYHFFIASEPPAVQEANYAETYIEVQPGLQNDLSEFASNPEFYFCLNSTVNYPSYAVSSDGDSMVYSIAGARVYNQTSQAVGPFFYLPGNSQYTFNVSMLPAVISPSSGTVNFTPALVAQGMMVVKADEYRNGTWIGSLMRQTSVIVSGNGTAISESNSNEISISPNPAGNRLYIKSQQPVDEYEIMDLSGRSLVKEKSCINKQVDISSLKNGFYFMKLKCANAVTTVRFLKEN